MALIEWCRFEPWPGHCVASVHPGVQMGAGKFNAGGNSAID